MVFRLWLPLLLLSACGGNVESGEAPPAAGGMPQSVGMGGAESAVVTTGGLSSGPECESIVVPPVEYECDPLGDLNQCGGGLACYPTVEFPDQPCERELYRMICALAGTATQWGACGGMSDCASGYICVVSDQATECLRVCNPDVNDCPRGLLCEPVDLAGMGACY